MKEKSVLHICLSPGWGGLEMYPIKVGKQLIDQGYKVYGLCITDSQVARGMRDAGIETFEVSGKKSLLLTKLPKLNRWLKERHVNLIHCHKSGDILISALLELLTKRRVIFTEHMGVTRPKTDVYHKWVYSHVDQVLSISDATYQRNIKALPIPIHKIKRLWLGTDISTSPIEDKDIRAAIKQELGIPPNSTVIGNVGRLCSGKGQLELIEAFSILANSNPKLDLLLVGGLTLSEGSDDEFVAKIESRIAGLKFKDRIHLVGFRKDTERMLAAMDIVCLPNHNEAFGLTAIEAMAAKKPIVGANTGALPEILEPVALLCNPLEPASIAQCIERYIDSPALAVQNSQLALERALNEFSIEGHMKKLTSFYKFEILQCY